MNIQIFFRVDSSSKIGTGHVKRSLVLAKFLEKTYDCTNYHISFISSDFEGNINDQIKQYYPVFVIKKDRFQDDNRAIFDWETDCQQTANIIGKDKGIDLLIVDHYRLDYRWETCMKNYVRKLMVIDDLFRQHNCDILLDQNISAIGQYRNMVPLNCRLLLGTKYVLLDEQFNSRKRKNHSGNVKHIHICFGGSDIDNITGLVIQFIIDNSSKISNFNSLIFDVVVGGANPNYNEIKKQVEGKKNFNLFRDVQNISDLLFKADLAIGAGGTSAYERCYMGLPTMVVTIADNQILVSGLLQEANTLTYLGHLRWDNVDFINTINMYINNSKEVILQSKNCKKIVDGFGPVRITAVINEVVYEL